MKLFYLLLLSLLLPTLSFAQSNYKQGYVVLNSGDIIRGYINTREWDITPRRIEFKKSPADRNTVNYYPSTLQSFEVDDISKYVTYTGKISMDPTDLDKAPSGLDTTRKQDTVFLKVIYAGSEVSLLSNHDDIKSRLFIRETGQEPTELIFRQYYNGESMLAKSNIYKGQLLYLASKYNTGTKATRMINGADFSVSSIEQAVIYINQDTVTQKHTPNGRLFLGGGLAQGTTSFNGDYGYYKFNKSTTAVPFLSVGYDVFQNPHTQKLVFRGEVSVSYNTPNFTYQENNSYAPNNITYGFNQVTFGITPQFIYNFYNSDAVKVYLDAGVSFNLSSYSNNKYTETGVSPFTQKNYYTLEPYWTSFPLKAGVLLNKRLEVFAMYTFPVAYTRYVSFSISTQVLGLGVHYCFDKTNAGKK